MDVVAESIQAVFDARQQTRGLKMVLRAGVFALFSRPASRCWSKSMGYMLADAKALK